MNTMDNPANSSGVATAGPPTQAEQKQSELPQQSIANLRKLSESLSAFQQCFTELQHHINTLRTSIDSILWPPHTNNNNNNINNNNATSAAAAAAAAAAVPVPEREPSIESDPSEDEEEEDEDEHEEEVKSLTSRSELEALCEKMNYQGLKKYMMNHLSHINELREQVPKALKLSPNPSRLVLDCIGKFYFQGRKSYIKGSQMTVTARKAKVLLLECLLIMIGEVEGEGGGGRGRGRGVEIEKRVKDEAEQAGLKWRMRIVSEGGLLKAQEIDARGLLLFIGCFGIPQGFSNRDIKDLVHVSNVKMIADALKRSSVLVAKILEMMDGMVANKMVVGAVDIAYSLGIEERFNPQRHLLLFLRESKDSFDKMKNNIDAKRKYLFDLKSVVKCLGFHKIDPSKLLPGWQLDMKIKSLEKEIEEFNKQIGGEKNMAQKRKIDETERLSNKEVKRSHFATTWMPQQQRVVNHVDSNSALVEGGGTAGHVYGYSMFPSVLNGIVAGLIHENVVGSLAGPVGGVAIGGPGAGISHARMDVVMQGGSYAGSHGGSRIDSTPGQMGSHVGHLYGSPSDAAVYETLSSHRYAYRPSYMEGSTGLPNNIPGDAYRPPPYFEGPAGLPNTTPGDAHRPPPHLEGSMGLPNTVASDAYKPLPYLEGSAGLPNTNPGDAYRPSPYLEGSMEFPNTVSSDVAGQSSGSRAVDAVPSAAPARPSSCSYWSR